MQLAEKQLQGTFTRCGSSSRRQVMKTREQKSRSVRYYSKAERGWISVQVFQLQTVSKCSLKISPAGKNSQDQIIRFLKSPTTEIARRRLPMSFSEYDKDNPILVSLQTRWGILIVYWKNILADNIRRRTSAIASEEDSNSRKSIRLRRTLWKDRRIIYGRKM